MLDFDIQLPRNLLRYQHHVTLPPPLSSPPRVLSDSRITLHRRSAGFPLTRTPEGCCSRLGGDPRCDRGGSAREPTRGPVGGDPPHPVYRPWDPRENPRRAILFSTDFGSSSPPRASWHGAALFPLCPSLPTYLPISVRSLTGERLGRLSPLVRDRIYPPGGRRGYSGPSRSRDRVLSRPDQPIDRSIMKTLGPDFRRLCLSSYSWCCRDLVRGQQLFVMPMCREWFSESSESFGGSRIPDPRRVRIDKRSRSVPFRRGLQDELR